MYTVYSICITDIVYIITCWMYNVHSIYNDSLDPRKWETSMHTCSIYSSSFSLAAAVVALVHNALDPRQWGALMCTSRMRLVYEALSY